MSHKIRKLKQRKTCLDDESQKQMEKDYKYMKIAYLTIKI